MEDIRKSFMYYVAAFCGMVTLGSCAQEVINEDLSASDSRMTVMTRGEGDPITSPVRLYVFDSDDQCVTMETLDAGSSSFTKNLPAGSYDVYALAGVDESRYVLPSKDEATKTTPITLKTGEQLGDLMTGHSSVTLSDGNTNETTLNLSRKVILLKSIVIKEVPAGTTDVSVKISPIQESLLLNGTYQGDEGAFSVALTKQSDGTTWKMATEDVYLLPSVGKPTITITIGTTAFPYNCPNELEANHKITIEGSYKEPTTTPAELALTGTINGVTWGEDHHVSFDFGPIDEPNTPSVGTLYEGHYVLEVNGKDVTLLSSTETPDLARTGPTQTQASIDNYLQTYNSTDNIGGWRIPNANEAAEIISQRTAIASTTSVPISNNSYYYYNSTGGLAAFKNDNGSLSSGNFAYALLRPVTTITIQ